MVKYLFELHKDRPLAYAEALSIARRDFGPLQILDAPQGFLFFETAEPLVDLQDKIAYTHAIYEWICPFTPDALAKVDWASYYGTSFSVRSVDRNVVDAIAHLVWNAVASPKVSLSDADTVFYVFFDQVFILCQTVSTAIHGRANHKRPVSSPVSLSHLLAMAMVNLTHGERVYDPFCGMGGILIEAGHLGRTLIGSDNSYRML